MRARVRQIAFDRQVSRDKLHLDIGTQNVGTLYRTGQGKNRKRRDQASTYEDSVEPADQDMEKGIG